MPGEQDWARTCLGEVIDLEYGRALQSEVRTGFGFPVFGSSGEVGRHGKAMVQGPGIVVGRKGTVGSVTWTDEDFWPIDTTYFVKMKTQDDLRLLYWRLSTLRLASLDSSTGVPGLNRNDAYEVDLALPPLPEQRRIAAILDTLDEAIRRTEQVIEKLKQMKQGLLHDLLTRGIDDNGELRPPPDESPHLYKDSPLGRIPRGWEVSGFGSCLVGSPQNGLYKPSSSYGQTGTPIVRIDGFYDGVLAPIGSLKRLKLASSERSVYGLEPGNILVNRVNSIDYVGKVALVPDLPEPVVFESNMMRCRIHADVTSPGFMVLWLTAPWARHWFHRCAKSAIAQASVNQSDVKALVVPQPPLHEQDLISAGTTRADRRIQSEAACLDKLRTLKHGLMDDLLTGRVRVSIPEEEQHA